MAEIELTEPYAFIAGTTVEWKILLPDYKPGDGYKLVYYFRDGSDNKKKIESTADGDYHYIKITPEDSAEFDAGNWYYQRILEKDTDKYFLDSAKIEVMANFNSAGTGYDPRTHAEKMLESVEAVLENRATSAQASRKVADRELRYMTHSQLLELKDYYEAEIRAERGQLFQSMGVTFV